MTRASRIFSFCFIVLIWITVVFLWRMFSNESWLEEDYVQQFVMEEWSPTLINRPKRPKPRTRIRQGSITPQPEQSQRQTDVAASERMACAAAARCLTQVFYAEQADIALPFDSTASAAERGDTVVLLPPDAFYVPPSATRVAVTSTGTVLSGNRVYGSIGTDRSKMRQNMISMMG